MARRSMGDTNGKGLANTTRTKEVADPDNDNEKPDSRIEELRAKNDKPFDPQSAANADGSENRAFAIGD